MKFCPIVISHSHVLLKGVVLISREKKLYLAPLGPGLPWLAP